MPLHLRVRPLGPRHASPALDMSDAEERAIWFDGYTRTCLERDLPPLSIEVKQPRIVVFEIP